jgi:hypothetical protein
VNCVVCACVLTIISTRADTIRIGRDHFFPFKPESLAGLFITFLTPPNCRRFVLDPKRQEAGERRPNFFFGALSAA